MNKTKLFLSLVLCGFLGGAWAAQTVGENFTPVKPITAQQGVDFATQPISPVASIAPAAPNKKAVVETPKAFDPLEVSSVAVKSTPQPKVKLPGVLNAPDNAAALDFNKTRIVEMSSADNPTVYLSVDDVNRIQLPFNPRVIAGDGITAKTSNNNLYVNFNDGVTRSVQIYLENPNSAATLGLQLVPKRISAQTIIVQDTIGAGGSSPAALKGNDYSTNIQGLMETLALGANPQGYSKTRLEYPPVAMNGYIVMPLEKYAGSDKDIFVYEAKNAQSAPLTLRESQFDGPGVLAISIYPKPNLGAGEKVKVFVLARKGANKD